MSGVILFTEPNHEEYLTLLNTMNEYEITIDSKVLGIMESLFFGTVTGYLIYKMREYMRPVILYDDEKIIFNISKEFNLMFIWSEIQPSKVQIRWRPYMYKSDFLLFVFVNHNNSKQNKTFLIPSNYQGVNDLVLCLHKHGVLERYGIEK